MEGGGGLDAAKLTANAETLVLRVSSLWTYCLSGRPELRPKGCPMLQGVAAQSTLVGARVIRQEPTIYHQNKTVTVPSCVRHQVQDRSGHLVLVAWVSCQFCSGILAGDVRREITADSPILCRGTSSRGMTPPVLSYCFDTAVVMSDGNPTSAPSTKSGVGRDVCLSTYSLAQ